MRRLRVIYALAAALPAFSQTALKITTTSPLPTATLNSPYNATFQASGGQTPYTWSTDSNVPGLSLNSNGTLAGTPTQAGTYNLLVGVADAARARQTASGSFSITVQPLPPLTITSSSPLPAGTLGTSYSYAMGASGGKPPYTWSVAGGSFPPGLTLSSGGQISGTPTAAGSDSITIKVTDSELTAGPPVSAQAQFTLAIQASPLTVTSISPLPNGTATAKYSYTMTATGGTAPYNWSVVGGNLPSGISVSSTGHITGHFKGAPPFVSVSVAPPGTSGAPPLAITTPTPLPNGATGASYSLTFAAAGGSPPYNFATSPGTVGGLTLASTGLLSGTPTTAGTYNFTVQVTDSPPQGVTPQVASKGFVLRIVQPLTVTTPSPINASVGTSLTVVMTATGGTFPYLWQLASGSQLPPGFALDTTSGFLSGTPTTAGTFNFTVQATDQAGNTATKALAMIVTAAGVISITTAPAAPNGAVGASYSLTFAATGGVSPLTWAVASGTLPAGLTLNTTTGVLSGTPQSAGASSFVIRVTDYSGATTTKSFTLTISPAGQGALITVTSLTFTALAGGNAPATQSFALATSASPLQFTIATDSGSTGSPVPPWLSVLLLQGATPARIPVAVDQTGLQPGTYPARILVNTSDGHQSIVSVTLTVVAAAPQLDVSPGYLRYGGPVSTLTATEEDLLVQNLGGGGPLAFQASVVGTPSWLSITPASGLAGPNAPVLLKVLVNAQGLDVGPRIAMIHVASAAGSVDIPISLFVRAAGAAIGTDASGVQFEASQGGGDSNTEIVNVLNLGDGTLNWTAQLITGGAWLSISGPASGQSTATASSRLALLVNTSALVAGPYYALVSITDPNATNSPQFFTVMLNVDPATAVIAPQPDPEGLFFVAKAGGASPPAQTVNVFASSSTAVAFQTSASAAGGGTWLTATPVSGTTSTLATAQVSVTVNPLNLKAGIYSGEVAFALSNTSIRSTNVTLVVQPSTVTTAASEGASEGKRAVIQATVPGCTPAKLALAPTSLANSFGAPAGWPTLLAARLADDCGSPVLNGQVVATFSNGDPALTMKLTDSTLGVYSATWAPSRVTGSMTMTAHGSAPNLASVSVDITGAVTANQAPVLATNGTLNLVNPVVGAPLAPGTVSQINGSSLAAANAQPGTIPAPLTFNGTQVLIGSFVAPLYALSSGQLTVQLPNELSPNQEYPVVVSANGGFTLPDTITTAAAASGVFVYPDTSVIAEHMDSSLVNADSPASQNETIQIFLAGMGATDTPVASGAASPSNPPANVLATPLVTVGGQQAAIVFAQLVPGGVGIYQVAFTVPAGLSTGYLPLTISQNGIAANAATLPVR